MSADSLVTVLIAASSVLSAVAVATLGGVIRISLRWGAMQQQLTVLCEAVARIETRLRRVEARR